MATVKDAIASMVENIEQKTGRKMSEWLALARKSGHEAHGKLVAWLKAEHALSHGYANHIAKEALRSGGNADGDLLAAQFAGGKSALKPLYDSMIKMVRSLGSDVEIAPKKNNVSIRRSKQFALLQPSTATRLDLGLILKGVAAKGRLEKSGSFNAMFTHRVRLTSAAEIDPELKRWLAMAYDAA